MQQTCVSPIHGEIKIHCAHTALVSLAELKPNPENPNKHPEKQIELFMKILQFNGFRRPVVVSKLSGFVVKGHGALEAATAMNLNVVPVDFQEYASQEQEIADMIADNQLQEWSDLDPAKLNDLLSQLNTGELDLEVTGFAKSELAKLLENFESSLKVPEGAEVGKESEEMTAEKEGAQEISAQDFQNFAHTCPKCGFGFNE